MYPAQYVWGEHVLALDRLTCVNTLLDRQAEADCKELVANELCVLLCRCESGCVCDESFLDGYQEAHRSLLNLHGFYVSQNDSCVISVQVSCCLSLQV